MHRLGLVRVAFPTLIVVSLVSTQAWATPQTIRVSISTSGKEANDSGSSRR